MQGSLVISIFFIKSIFLGDAKLYQTVKLTHLDVHKLMSERIRCVSYVILLFVQCVVDDPWLSNDYMISNSDWVLCV